MTTSSNIHEPSNDQAFRNVIANQLNSSITVLNFHADWVPQCAQMNDVVAELASIHSNIDFILINADVLEDTCDEYNISAVPSFIILKNGTQVDQMNGAQSLELTNIIEKFGKQATQRPAKALSTSPPDDLDLSPTLSSLRLKQLIEMAPVVLFMKGTPHQPKCGFSRQTVDLLAKYNTRYSTFNILADDQVRQALKVYSNWPTYPQVYINGELIGGLDILKELDASDQLRALIPVELDLNERLVQLIKRANVMIFIKGIPSAPKCGFSKQLVGILNDLQVTYDYFDILSDDDVRQGLKAFSNWPTFPQVYINGELVGGLDIVKELVQTNEFLPMITN